MWILWSRCEASAWKNDKRKKKITSGKTIWKGSGFLQTLILYIICHIILSIYHHYHIISRSHLARVGETVGSLATFTARRGREQLWSSELRCSGSSDGPEEAVEIRKALAEVTGAVWGSVGTTARQWIERFAPRIWNCDNDDSLCESVWSL